MKIMDYVSYEVKTAKSELGFRFRKITLSRLIKALRRKGYVINWYSESGQLLSLYGLLNETASADSVSVIDDSGNVMIFIDDALPEELKVFTILHELGHIKLNHDSRNIIKEHQEKESDLFAIKFLLNTCKRYIYILVSFLTSIALLICLVGFAFFNADRTIPTPVSSQPVVSTDVNATYYWTESGTVYHYYVDCQSLKHSTNILNGSLSQAQKEKDRLCKFCERRCEEN